MVFEQEMLSIGGKRDDGRRANGGRPGLFRFAVQAFLNQLQNRISLKPKDFWGKSQDQTDPAHLVHQGAMAVAPICHKFKLGDLLRTLLATRFEHLSGHKRSEFRLPRLLEIIFSNCEALTHAVNHVVRLDYALERLALATLNCHCWRSRHG